MFNLVGALLWAVGLPLAGFALGEAMGEELDRWLLLILAGVVAASLLPTAWHLWSRNREQIKALARSWTGRGG